MSDHYNQSATQQEMDLTDIFSLIGRFFKNIVYFFFRVFDFVLKMWWVILLLIIAGIALGYFTKGAPSYEANLLLKTNFDSQSYTYTAINQFNSNLAEGDVDFITSLGQDPETFSLKAVSIEPVVEVLDLIAYIGENDRALGAMTREFKLDDDKELFATDRFLSTYKYHKLSLGLSSDTNLKDIQTLMSFINDKPYAQELKTKGLVNHKEFLKSQEKSIEQIDALINSYSEENGLLDSKSEDGFYFNNRSDNIADLFDVKTLLVRHLEEDKNDDVSYTDVAVIVSDIQASKDSSILDNLIIIYPVLFVFLFLALSGVVSLYKSYRREQMSIQA